MPLPFRLVQQGEPQERLRAEFLSWWGPSVGLIKCIQKRMKYRYISSHSSQIGLSKILRLPLLNCLAPQGWFTYAGTLSEAELSLSKIFAYQFKVAL